MKKNGAQTLLMGGQACVLYGAAEFSRDLDLMVLCESQNLSHVEAALQELQAVRIAVPDLHTDHLTRGHAVHYRCQREDVQKLRIDLMSVLRGVDSFRELWDRRTTLLFNGEEVELLSLPDLVQAKKTQRDKDWPMIRRLVEESYFRREPEPSPASVKFWLLELRTPELLLRVCSDFPAAANALAPVRAALQSALAGDLTGVTAALVSEESAIRELDRIYWAPLKRELEQFRHSGTSHASPTADMIPRAE